MENKFYLDTLPLFKKLHTLFAPWRTHNPRTGSYMWKKETPSEAKLAWRRMCYAWDKRDHVLHVLKLNNKDNS